MGALEDLVGEGDGIGCEAPRVGQDVEGAFGLEADPRPIVRRPSTITRRRSAKMRRNRAVSWAASRSAATPAHCTNSFVEMKKLPYTVWSARTCSRGAIIQPSRQPVMAKAFENPLSTNAWSVNSRIERSRPPSVRPW